MKEQPSSISSNESLLFVGSYTRKEGHVDGKAQGIYALKLNTDSGILSETNLKVPTVNPSYISVNAKSNSIYAVNEVADNSPDGGATISSFKVNFENESIDQMNSVNAMGGAPCHISEHEGHIFTANYVGGNHAVYKVNENGQLSENTQVINLSGKGTTPRQESPHAHMITRNPHTGDLFSVDLGTDSIRIYAFNAQTSSLIRTGYIKSEDGYGPRHLTFHPEKDIIYVINELYGSVDVYTSSNNEYQNIQNITSTLNEDQKIAACAAIHVHPNGKFLYASNRGSYNSVIIYGIQEDGSLEIIGEKSTKGITPRDFAIDPTGKFLLVAHQDSGNIVVFSIDQETGRLLDINSEINVPTPVCLKFWQ